jgi:hypothetical protein
MARADAGPEPSPTTMPLSTNLSTWCKGELVGNVSKNERTALSRYRELGGVEEVDHIGVVHCRGRACDCPSSVTA